MFCFWVRRRYDQFSLCGAEGTHILGHPGRTEAIFRELVLRGEEAGRDGRFPKSVS